MTFETPVPNPQTLAQRMAVGRIPVPEALRYAMILADALRKIHESGHVHGAVSPACVSLGRGGLELMPALGSAGEVTPYTAPEVVEGRPADSRSDIFSFGAILYEMLTGRPTFKGDTPETLATAITTSVPAPSGSPSVDRLVGTCLAKNPAQRLQRIQKLTLELKLLSVAVRRAETQIAPRRDDSPTRTDVEQLETRLAVRIAAVEQGVASIIDRIAAIEPALAAGKQELKAVEERAGVRLGSIEERIGSLERSVEAAAGLGERMEQSIAAARQEAVRLRSEVAGDLQAIDKTIKAQAAQIDSARTALAQTDDLVERVVEALESLQTIVLEHTEERPVAAV